MPLSAAYSMAKHVHVTTVVVSGCLFFVRGLWVMVDSPWLRRRWVRIVPHVIDTVLLLSAIALMVLIQQYPLVHHWLTAKVVALLAYIGLGTIAITRGKNRNIRFAAWITALFIYAYIIAVALKRNPWPV